MTHAEPPQLAGAASAHGSTPAQVSNNEVTKSITTASSPTEYAELCMGMRLGKSAIRNAGRLRAAELRGDAVLARVPTAM